MGQVLEMVLILVPILLIRISHESCSLHITFQIHCCGLLYSTSLYYIIFVTSVDVPTSTSDISNFLHDLFS